MAIHACLGKVAECTPWTAGAFDLSQSTIVELTKNLRDSDFGIFVFAPDDIANIRGDLLNVPRDNVVYEAGLFSGYLCPERCFIVIPQTGPIHVPSDLLGMTLGHYEDDRTDGNDESAVGSFCSKVRKQIEKQGLFEGHASERLRELSVRFECCDWITDEEARVDQKRKIADDMNSFCAAHPINKHRLLAHHRSGHYIALLIAISSRPERGDSDLILQIRRKHLSPGFAHYKLLDAVEAIKTNGCCTVEQRSALSAWLKQLPNASTAIADRIARLTAS